MTSQIYEIKLRSLDLNLKNYIFIQYFFIFLK